MESVLPQIPLSERTQPWLVTLSDDGRGSPAVSGAYTSTTMRRALPSVEHFVFCHPDSSLLNTAVFCTMIVSAHLRAAPPAAAALLVVAGSGGCHRRDCLVAAIAARPHHPPDPPTCRRSRCSGRAWWRQAAPPALWQRSRWWPRPATELACRAAEPADPPWVLGRRCCCAR